MTTEPSGRREPSRFFRWLVLVFISVGMFGNYYVYDCISPMADILKEQLRFYGREHRAAPGRSTSIPNIFMVLLGGLLIDRIGSRKAMLLFGALCFAGAAITASSDALPLMAAGRLVFGLGAESMIVSTNTGIARWFKGKELSFAFGVNLTIARLGSFAALNSPSWAKAAFVSWKIPLLISVGFATFCVLGPAVYYALETGAEKRFAWAGRAPPTRSSGRTSSTSARRTGFIVALCITFYSGIFRSRRSP